MGALGRETKWRNRWWVTNPFEESKDRQRMEEPVPAEELMVANDSAMQFASSDGPNTLASRWRKMSSRISSGRAEMISCAIAETSSTSLYRQCNW